MLNITKIKSLYGMSAILDNNVINDFIELDRLDLLNDVFGRVEVPQSILQNELIIDGHSEVVHEKLVFSGVSIETVTGYTFFETVKEKYKSLTDYDIEVVVIAKERAVLCTSNEDQVMRACNEFDIEYTGSIGIICCAWEHRLISFDEFSLLIRTLFFETSAWISNKLKNSICQHYHIPNRPPSNDE